MFKNLLLIALLSTGSFALSAEEFQEQQMQDFNSYKKSQEEGFKAYQQEQMKAFEDYKKELGAFWDEPKLSTKKSWVGYTEDKKTRTDVDFEQETIKVETIASSPQEAKQKLQLALAKAVTVDTKTVQETDPLEKKIAKIKKPQDLVDAKVKAEPILSTVVFNKPPTKESLVEYVKKHVDDKKITVENTSKVKHAKVYSISVKMPADAMVKRSRVYYDEVKKQAQRQKLPLPLVFAIMHSESSFNPRARSHIPAYGLMQIVPKTAGIDTYKYLYKEKKLVSGAYLYNSTNNITMGSAYLHILYYNYLKKIKNPDSRLYCTIAAYNTGAGNIAWAFTKKYNMNKAAPLINALTPQEVYNKLLKDLRFDEPKHYLKNVSKRMSAYHKIYGS
ncbi:DUF3393 domain-containing protein [bacterium]|nr:DUF3393 domain-containing protein [bacterium]MBU1991188.1 DUF3393 domain-containing protein [bacterium]